MSVYKIVLSRCTPDSTSFNMAKAALIKSQNSTASLYSVSSSNANWFSSFIADVWTLRNYVFGLGLGFSVVASFLFLYFLRIPGLLFLIVWILVFGIEILLIVSTALLAQLASTWKNDDSKANYEIIAVQVFEYIGIALCISYFCLMIVLRKRIMLALAIIKEAGRAYASMPALIVLPVVQAVGFCVFLVPWFIYLVFLASSGDIESVQVTNPYYGTNPLVPKTLSYRSFQYADNTKWAFLYLLFCWFWSSQWIIAIGQLVISLSFTAWYFTKDKGATGNGTVFWAFRTAIFKHSGTAAFGSLVIAIVKTIRVVVAYLQRKAEKADSKIAKVLLCCIQCCMWCVEKCVKFMNKNAYIQTAIHGYSFCRAARSAFFLILRNILRVAAVNMVSDFVIGLGKFLIPGLTTFIAYLAVVYANKDLSDSEISGIMGPMVCTYVLAYFVTCMFIEIYSMGIETILICYVADEEMFSVENRFAGE